MKNHRTKSTGKSLLLLGVSLLLVIQATQASSYTFSQITLATQSNAVVNHCNDGDADATRLAAGIRATDPTGYSDFTIIVIFFKASPTAAVPSCAQIATNQRASAIDPLLNMEFTIIGGVEGNTQGDIRYTIGSDETVIRKLPYAAKGYTMPQNQVNAHTFSVSGIPFGMAMILFDNGSSTLSIFRIAAYFFKDFGGYTFTCHNSCSSVGCTGPNSNHCTSCSSHASLVGSTIHSALSGSCFCPSGKVTSDGSGCEATCTGNCASCDTTSANNCITCPDTTHWSITRDSNGVGPCDPICHSTCKVGRCTTPAATDCEECPNTTDWIFHGVGANPGRCQPICHPSCKADRCANADVTGCLECPNTTEWILPTTPGECKRRCHDNCKQYMCTGTNENQCTECPNTTDWTFSGSAGNPGECQRICHSSCKATRCSGPGANQCLECPNTTEWTLNAGTCTEKGAAIICHAACHSCLGPTENECLVCKDPNSIVLQKTVGSDAGPCVNCADPSRRESPECSSRVVTINLSALTINSPTTAQSASSGTFEPMKAPIRVPNKGKHIIRLALPERILERITQLG